MSKKIVIIGSGAAGMSAASAARAADPEADITVFTEDRDVAYSPCMIPWVLEGKSTWNEMIMHDPAWYAKERNIKIVTETKVESVVNDTPRGAPAVRTVTAGGKTYEYDSLVLATGGKVFIPPIEGTQLPGVFTVRTVKGGQEIEAYLKKSQKVAVAGAGVIGLELALALVNIGKDVTVIEMMDQVIPRIADKDMADPMQAYLESKGVKFMMRTPVQGVIGKDKVEAVNAGGTEVPCDMVIFATGVRANTDIAKELGLDIGQLGALCAAPTLQAYKRGRLCPDIFVCGDVLQCQSAVYPGPTMSQLGSSAVKEGRVQPLGQRHRREADRGNRNVPRTRLLVRRRDRHREGRRPHPRQVLPRRQGAHRQGHRRQEDPPPHRRPDHRRGGGHGPHRLADQRHPRRHHRGGVPRTL